MIVSNELLLHGLKPIANAYKAAGVIFACYFEVS
jgi:hypothetical protein